MKARDKYGNLVDFDDGILCDVTTKGLVGHYAETVVQSMAYCLRTFLAEEPFESGQAIGMLRTVYVQCFTLCCVMEDICPIERDVNAIFDAIFGSDSDERHIIDTFQSSYSRVEEASQDPNMCSRALDALRSEFLSDERLKGLLGLLVGTLGWIERVGTERSAWLAKLEADADT